VDFTKSNLKMIAVSALTVLVLIAACGGGESNTSDTVNTVVETGAIQADDLRDPNHSDLAYDSYEFEAMAFDTVTVETVSDGFVPLLKLVEVSTGAVIAEWEAEYSPDDNLSYIIAGPGRYEARIYSLDGGMGDYTITITVSS
jgi:hypothetical protein